LTIYNKSAFLAAQQFGIVDELIYNIEQQINLEEKIWLIYIYKFNNDIYIGLTKDIKRRHYEHKTKHRDSIYKYCINNNINPNTIEYQIILSQLTAKESQEKEDYYKEYYKEQGYNILNKGKTGIGSSSLGSITTKWNEQTCYQEAQKYIWYKDFHRKSPRAYTVAMTNGWILKYDWLKHRIRDTKPIIQYDLNGNKIKEFASIYQINKELGYDSHTIRRACLKIEQLTAYNYIWSYK